jgi:RNA polymerase sigma factor (sigma-70 family)
MESGSVKWPQRPDPGRVAPAPAGFGRLVLPHLDSAHNLARWLVRDPSLAEDVVQEAVLRALSYFASFRGGDARAWLMRIVRNVAYDALASGRAGAPCADDQQALDVPDPADDPEVALDRSQQIESLDRALAALPVELRECLVLRELEELSYRQIAEVTGVPVGTVMSRLWRARRAILGGQVEGNER